MIRKTNKVGLPKYIKNPGYLVLQKRETFSLQKLTADIIIHLTVANLSAMPLNRSEAAKIDLVVIKMLLLFKCKLLCYHAY